MSKNILFVILLMVGFCWAESKNLNTKDKVSLIGTLSFEKYPDANDRMETVDVLTLESPITVDEDDFGGPVTHVQKMQLALMGKSRILNSYQGKRLKVFGTLFYPENDHHHTPILMKVERLTVTSK